MDERILTVNVAEYLGVKEKYYSRYIYQRKGLQHILQTINTENNVH
jgi:hypothetical protein